MSRRTKITIVVLSVLVLSLLVLHQNPRIPMAQSTILQKASQHGWYWIIAVQMWLGVDPDGPDQTPLHYAIVNNYPRIAALAISHGADLDREFASGEPDGPPIAWALRYGRNDIAEMLLQRDIRVDYKASFVGYSLLHMAVELGDANLVRLLLEKGANPNASDYSGATPLMLAVAYKRLKIKDILCRAGAKESSKKSIGVHEHYCVYVRNKTTLPKTR